MRIGSSIFLLCGLLAFVSCDDEATDVQASRTVTLRFVAEAGVENTSFTTFSDSASLPSIYSFDDTEKYNVTMLKFLMTNVTLETADFIYEDEVTTNRDNPQGFYLVQFDSTSSTSLTFEVPAIGAIESVSFQLGVDSSTVQQGAFSGVLAQTAGGARRSNMFWNWIAGYIAMKLEGKATQSPGGAFGETISETQNNGFAFHLGGWESAANNVTTIELNLPQPLTETGDQAIDIVFDVQDFLSSSTVDLTEGLNVHNPASGQLYLQDVKESFRIR